MIFLWFNCLTIPHKWFGLYSIESIKKGGERISVYIVYRYTLHILYAKNVTQLDDELGQRADQDEKISLKNQFSIQCDVKSTENCIQRIILY